MPMKHKFSAKDEEKIIKFVKSNDILYNVKHKKFRNIAAKNYVWLQLATELNMDVDLVKKKWQTMKDYFVRLQQKKAIDSVASTSLLSKRNESLSFLLQLPILKKNNISSVVEPSTDPKPQAQVDSVDTNSNADDSSSDDGSVPRGSISQTAKPKNRIVSRMNESNKNDILKVLLAHRLKPEKPVDDIQQFFDFIVATVRKFPPVTIAQIQQKIAQIVGETEIKWANKAITFEHIYCDALGDQEDFMSEEEII